MNLGRIFTLRRGRIKELVNRRVYLVEDELNGNEIVTTASGMEVAKGKVRNVGDTVYVVVSPQDLFRGRFLNKSDIKSEYGNLLLQDQLLIEEGKDPLA